MADPLDTRALLALVPRLLPRTTSSPLPQPTDAIAALIHAVYIALGFRLTASTGHVQVSATEANAVGSESAKDLDDGASDTTTAVDVQDESVSTGENALPEGWNARGEDSYAFEYRHEQSSLVFRVRVGRMGARIQLDAMAEDGAPHTISILVADLLDTSTFPLPSIATGGNSAREAPAMGFRSLEVVRELVARYNREVITRLIPGLSKAGYTQPSVVDTPGGSRAPRPPNNPSHEPSPAQPSPLVDPLFPPRGVFPNPASIGARDLDPLGSFQRPGSFNPDRDGGGMLVDFNHPLFDSRNRSRNPDFDGPGGLIQPPGSRWDPVGPGGNVGGPRFPSAGGNPLGGVGVTDPEWGDEMPPPGEYGPDMSGGLGGALGRGRGGNRGGLGGSFGGGFGGYGGYGGLGGGGGIGGGRFGGSGGGGMFM